MLTLSLIEPGLLIKGGPGSGFHGHAGRPGKVGGSASDGMSAIQKVQAKHLAKRKYNTRKHDRLKEASTRLTDEERELLRKGDRGARDKLNRHADEIEAEAKQELERELAAIDSGIEKPHEAPTPDKWDERREAELRAKHRIDNRLKEAGKRMTDDERAALQRRERWAMDLYRKHSQDVITEARADLEKTLTEIERKAKTIAKMLPPYLLN
jgi:uncharacterized membrane protein